MLRICELTVSFGEKRVLDSFSLTLPGGGSHGPGRAVGLRKDHPAARPGRV